MPPRRHAATPLRSQSKLLEPAKSSEKMYMVDDHVAVAVAGITADANILINQARLHAQRYRFSFQEPQPVEQLVQSLCDEKQARAPRSLMARTPSMPYVLFAAISPAALKPVRSRVRTDGGLDSARA